MKQSIVNIGIFFTLIALAGCAGVAEKFTSEEKVNLEPFATTTIQMVNTIDYGLEQNKSILLKPYLKTEDKPELRHLYALDEELYRVLRGVMAYSIKLVSLSSSTLTSEEKVKAFTDYIDKLDKPALQYHISQGNVTQQDFIDILANIRQQEDLLDAMRAAQPMIQFVLQHVDFLTDEIKRQETKAASEIDHAIDNDYASEIAYVTMLVARRKLTLEVLVLVDEQYKGKSNALNELNGLDVLSRLGMKTKHVTTSNIKQVEQDLVAELESMQHQLDLLEKDHDYYMKVHKELDEQVKFHDQEVRKTKGIIQLWSNAHFKMANGITDPADWFDITDPGGEFFELLKSAVNR